MRFLKNRLFLAFSLLVAIPVAIAACSSDPEIVEKIVEVEKVVEVEKEVQVEVTKVVEKEVTVEKKS